MVPAPQGLEWPLKTQPSSRVITEAKEWQDQSILFPHEGLRWYHAQLRNIIPTLSAAVTWKHKRLFAFLNDYYIPNVHEHHDNEENIYHPWVMEKLGDTSSGNSKIKPAHVRLLEELKVIGSFDGKLSDAKELAEFKTKFMDLMEYFDDHLAEEEEFYPTALRTSGVTAAEHDAIVQKIIQTDGLDGGKRMLPVIVYCMHSWAGSQDADAFVGNMPGPIQMFLTKCWLPDFFAKQYTPLMVLQGDEEKAVAESSCQLCVIQ